MEVFGLVDVLIDYCYNHEITLLLGGDDYRNAIADRKRYGAYDKVMLADFSIKPERNEYKINSITWSGLIALGQTSEETTRASLNELWVQKYERRLKSLAADLQIIYNDILCANSLTMVSEEWKPDLNKYDLNADFITTFVTIRYDG